nr:hypothetical protein [Tanacetum cinerariifolium]
MACLLEPWLILLTKKVNYCVWRASLDSLATRFNLSYRGVVLNSLSCPFCERDVEDQYMLSRPSHLEKSLELVQFRRSFSVPFILNFEHSSWKYMSDGKSKDGKVSSSLATRFNISSRGVVLDSLSCPFCERDVEDLEHCIIDALTSFPFGGKRERFFTCDFQNTWAVWKWKNRIVNAHSDSILKIKDEDIFPGIQRLSKTWIAVLPSPKSANWDVWFTSLSYSYV